MAAADRNEKGGKASEQEKRQIFGEEDFVPFQLLLRGDGGHRTIDPEKQARQYCEEKRLEAEALIEAARVKAAAIEKQARDEGFARGSKEGEAAGRAKYDETVRRLVALMAGIDTQRPSLHQQYEAELWPVVEAMVRRLAQHEVSVNPRVIVACVRKTLEFVAASSYVRIRLHPEDFRRIKEAGLDSPELFAGRERLDLIEDPGVAMGGCVIGSDFGEIDASFDAFQERLLAAVGQAFLSSLSEQSS